jgi:hypothetical protein
MIEPDELRVKRMFILDQMIAETDPAKRAKILLDCPYYYFVAHQLDFRNNLKRVGSAVEQDYFTAVSNYMKATHKGRLNMLALVARTFTALEVVTQSEGEGA